MTFRPNGVPFFGLVMVLAPFAAWDSVRGMLKSVAQSIIIATARPYISRELPGWGKIYELIDRNTRGWLWNPAPVKTIRARPHGYLMSLNLSGWTDRFAFFLGRWHDLATQLLMSAVIHPGDTVVDIGANRGMFALVASSLVSKSGRVICYEPNPDCVATLRREVSANRIENLDLRPYALGNRDEELILSIPLSDHDQATLSVNAFSNDAVRKVKSKVAIGDQELKAFSPSVIKIDVEGFEFNVIRGLADTIDRCHPLIIMEINPPLLRSCDTSLQEITEEMTKHHYKAFKIGLTKSNGQHNLKISPMIDDRRYCDAVWISTDAIGDFAKYLKES